MLERARQCWTLFNRCEIKRHALAVLVGIAACLPGTSGWTHGAPIIPATLFPDHSTLTASAVDELVEKLWRAARTGDLEALNEALSEGADVNAMTPYRSTALVFAADRGHAEIVRRLLEAGADPNIKDTFYNMYPLDWARSNRRDEVVELLLNHGLANSDELFLQYVNTREVKWANVLLASGKVSERAIAIGRAYAVQGGNESVLELFVDSKIEPLEIIALADESLERLSGTFATADGRKHGTLSTRDGKARIAWRNFGFVTLLPVGEQEFVANLDTLRLVWEDDKLVGLTLSEGGQSFELRRLADQPASVSGEPTPPAETPAEESDSPYVPSVADLEVSSPNWPRFRGIGSRGIADGQHPPTSWDATSETNLLWKTTIPGLGNSCPTIWGERLFITSAVGITADQDVRIGQYGDVASVEDQSPHDFIVYCLNKKTGEIIWQKTAYSGPPAVRRHSKSSHANPTVTTDGQYVIAFFGSEGLYCYDFEGNLVWKQDLGVLDSGWFYDAGYQWGFGSSPIIFEDKVIVQCDIQSGSFVAAFDVATGQEIWRTMRDEIPTWPTPNVHQFGDMPMLITHGTRAARGYDARDGAWLWSLKGHSEIVVPTPFVANQLIYVASGYSPIQPIVAIRPTMRGELELPGVQKDDGTTTPEAPDQLAWSVNRGGPYMPTPIAYGDYLYVCSNAGVLTCYHATTGEEMYRERIKTGGIASFTASPIAADGHLYFSAEDGRVAVVRAGPRFRLVSANLCGGNILSTPAISEGVFYVRTLSELVAFAKSDEEE
jgi:outer membrane protein assembly factor BamB